MRISFQVKVFILYVCVCVYMWAHTQVCVFICIYSCTGATTDVYLSDCRMCMPQGTCGG